MQDESISLTSNAVSDNDIKKLKDQQEGITIRENNGESELIRAASDDKDDG